MTTRHVTRIAPAVPTSDGAGVRLNRALGTAVIGAVDPFLMLDEFHSDNASDYIAGFPAHPHRGFETVTIMLDGSMEHRDSAGNRGLLGPGSVQWMTAGRGIIHSEMPRQENGLMRGFQLWVNLPATHKMAEPRYQDLPGDAIPTVNHGDGEVRVIAGSLGDTSGPVAEIVTRPILFDIRLDGDGEMTLPLPEAHNAFVYVYEGTATVGGHDVDRGHLAVLDHGATLHLGATGTSTRVLLAAGAPIGEPIARYGPFVMNTQAEIMQAIRDYQTGSFA